MSQSVRNETAGVSQEAKIHAAGPKDDFGSLRRTSNGDEASREHSASSSTHAHDIFFSATREIYLILAAARIRPMVLHGGLGVTGLATSASGTDQPNPEPGARGGFR